MNFDATRRQHDINFLKSNRVDLIVIGGGITGAGIALDAVMRGLQVALLERVDFAFGTSSRSTKLIHGGLRYLKQLEFGLVKEVGSERAIVHKLAPHLVIPEKMLLPLYEGKQMGYWLTSLGLKLYDFLANVRESDQRRMLTRAQTLKAEPLLNPTGVKGGAIYAEYRTDDARLTIEIIKTAARHGAYIANYAEVTDFILEGDHVAGVHVKDMRTGAGFNLLGKAIINAAGPWVDDLRERNHSRQGKRLHLTKGVHIVFDRKRLPIQQSIYFEVGDGRMIFAIPRDRFTYVGTTDTGFEGQKDDPGITPDDAIYLVNAVNSVFPSAELTLGDIRSWWSGLRPLIHEEGKSASELSRKDEIFESPSGLLSIAGGKLTGYRRMAERVVDLAVERHFSERRLNACNTRHVPINKVSFQDYEDVRRFQADLIQRNAGWAEEIPRLVALYGSEALNILNGLPQDRQVSSLWLAEREYCTRHEMVIDPEDFLIRRSGLLYFGCDLMDGEFLKRLADGDEASLARMQDVLSRQRLFSL